MIRVILLLTFVISISESRNVPEYEIYEIIQNRNGINIRTVQSKVDLKGRSSQSDANNERHELIALQNVLNQLHQYDDDTDDILDDIHVEEPAFVDKTKSVTPQNQILLHLFAPKQFQSNNFIRNLGRQILRQKEPNYARTSAPRHRYVYAR